LVAKEQVSSAVRPGLATGGAADVAGVVGVGAAGSGIVSDRTGLAASAIEIGRGIGTGASATYTIGEAGAEVDAPVAGSSLLSSCTELSSYSHVVDILGSGGVDARVFGGGGGEGGNQQSGCGGIS